VLRVLARFPVQCAAQGVPRSRPAWRRVLENEVSIIPRGLEALVWSLGCIWTVWVEQLISESRPRLQCARMFVRIFLSINFILGHLAWYGFALRSSHPFRRQV
jgi:hypothetical protein